MAGRDDRARIEQIIGESLVKAAHIILGARIYQSSRILSKPGAKSWVRPAKAAVFCKRIGVVCRLRRVESPGCFPSILRPYKPWLLQTQSSCNWNASAKFTPFYLAQLRSPDCKERAV